MCFQFRTVSTASLLTAVGWLFVAGRLGAQESAVPVVEPPVRRIATAIPAISTDGLATSISTRPEPDDRPLLSISDALSMLDALAGSIEESGDVISPAPQSASDSPDRHVARVRSVTGYIQSVDAMNPTLPFYQWHFIDKNKVSARRVDTDEFLPIQPLPHVTAVGFSVKRGDVRISSIEVEAVDGSTFEFDIGEVVHESSPRRNVCFLPTEIKLKSVRIRYRGLTKPGQSEPRLMLEAGISSLPESARESVHRLSMAEMALRSGDRPAAGVHIRDAIDALTNYRDSRGL